MSIVFDLFCGTGGFSYGFERSGLGFKTKFGIDLLPNSVETFKANHALAFALAKDIRKVRRSVLSETLNIKPGDVDVIVGGPPCQGFSSIRPFRSSTEDDPRNSLFEEFASFVNFFRPRVFVLENVVGLATYKDGQTVAAMEECFHRLGYSSEWRLLNAAHYGVPQKRERFVMIGAMQGMEIRFPEPTHFCDSPTIGYRDRRRIVKSNQNDLFETARDLSPALTVMDAISDLPEVRSGEEKISYAAQPENAFQADRRNGATNLSLHIATSHTAKMLEIIKHAGRNIESIPKHLITSGFSSCYSRLDGDQPAVTLTVNFVHPASNRCIHPFQARALTPREGARIQSFDDTFVFKGSRTHIVKQIGNAVPPVLGAAIAKTVNAMLV